MVRGMQGFIRAALTAIFFILCISPDNTLVDGYIVSSSALGRRGRQARTGLREPWTMMVKPSVQVEHQGAIIRWADPSVLLWTESLSHAVHDSSFV